MINLFLFTDMFPFGKGESFISNEINEMSKRFDNIYIIPICMMCEYKLKRDLPENFHVLTPKKVKNIYNKGIPSKKQKFIWQITTNFPNLCRCFLSKELYSELYSMIKNRKISLINLQKLITVLSICLRNVHYFSPLINEKMFSEHKNIFYSYWFDSSLMMFKKILKKQRLHPDGLWISRGHRHDIYENETKGNYLPFRKKYFDCIDYLFIVTMDGYNYMIEHYPEYYDKIKLSYLGTIDNGYKINKRNNIFKIVTCSFVSPVKRLNLLVLALSKIRDYKIEWHHFGDGQLFTQLKIEAEKYLPESISFVFHGYTKNKQILDYYRKNNINLFINISSSEGLPISIQEAASFAIPIIATDVGSTREIVFNKKNGILLDKEFTSQDLIDAILYIINLRDFEYSKFCFESRKVWQEKFNANMVYKNFYSELLELLDSNI